MRLRTILIFVIALTLLGAMYAQRRGRGRNPFGYWEDNPAPFPPDGNEKTEYVFARLQYPSFGRGFYGRGGPRGWGGRRGGGGSWTTDFPKADRQFLQGVRRLTRIHTRSVEEVVDLNSDDIYDWPWIYGVEVGQWDLSDDQAAKLRDYLLRGGFLMVDDFHGTYEWDVYLASMQRVVPDRPS